MNDERNEEITHEETPQEQQQETVQEPKGSWKEARELIRKQGETIKELEGRQRIYEDSLRQNQKPPEEEFDVSSLPDDYIVEAKDVKRMREKDQKRYDALEKRQVMLDMRDKYDDFKKVCSPDNIDKLEKSDPYMSAAVKATPDPYTRWEMVYRAIKREGLYQAEDKEEKNMIADYNTSRPKTVSQAKSSQSRSALGQAGAWSGVLSEEQKQDYYKNALKKIQGE